ncbi:hypothetical protein AB0M44_41460 [Streptosporangium subroseum]|uniref:hypothetical protein n=1 Tax=Streptosporangium subroseum TaxID=106412 RepID=UPI003427C715
MATAAADLPLLLYRFRTIPTGGMSAETVLSKLAETAEHIGEFAREFAAQNWVDMDQDETANWRKALAGLEAAVATFRRTVNLIGGPGALPAIPQPPASTRSGRPGRTRVAAGGRAQSRPPWSEVRRSAAMTSLAWANRT